MAQERRLIKLKSPLSISRQKSFQELGLLFFGQATPILVQERNLHFPMHILMWREKLPIKARPEDCVSRHDLPPGVLKGGDVQLFRQRADQLLNICA
jgi:hypothetical protein